LAKSKKHEFKVQIILFFQNIKGGNHFLSETEKTEAPIVQKYCNLQPLLRVTY